MVASLTRCSLSPSAVTDRSNLIAGTGGLADDRSRGLAERGRGALRIARRRRPRDVGPQPVDGGGPGDSPAVLGNRRRVHPDHDQPGRAGSALLPRGDATQGGHRLLGQQLPVLRAEPHLQTRLRVRRSRPRALVDPHPQPAARGGGPWPSGHGDRISPRVGSCLQSWLRLGRLGVRSGRTAGAAGSRCCTPPRGAV